MRTILTTVILMFLFFFPTYNEVTIVKSEIKSNRAFAGYINDQFVTTEVCCEYWLELDQQPEIRVVKVFRLGFFHGITL